MSDQQPPLPPGPTPPPIPPIPQAAPPPVPPQAPPVQPYEQTSPIEAQAPTPEPPPAEPDAQAPAATGETEVVDYPWVDGVEVCHQCSKQHVNRRGSVTCHGHWSSGEPCRKLARRGQKVCGRHGGATRGALRNAKQRLALAAAEVEVRRLGYTITADVTPAEIMLEQVREAAWNVAVYRHMVQQLVPAVDYQQLWPDDDEDGAAYTGPLATTIDPEKFSAEAHIFVRMYDRERDRLMQYAKMCREANVEEAMVVVAERQGRWLIDTMDRVFERLTLTEQQRTVLPVVMTEVLGELES